MALKHKLNPLRFTSMSPKMAALVGYLVDEEFTTPAIEDVAVTSDGFVLAQHSGDCGMNNFIGDFENVRNNFDKLAECAGLEDDEMREFKKLFKNRFKIR